jgi:hypothetical protein
MRTLLLDEEEINIIMERRQKIIDNDNMKNLCDEFAEWIEKASDYGVAIVDRDGETIKEAGICALLTDKTISLY